MTALWASLVETVPMRPSSSVLGDKDEAATKIGFSEQTASTIAARIINSLLNCPSRFCASCLTKFCPAVTSRLQCLDTPDLHLALLESFERPQRQLHLLDM